MKTLSKKFKFIAIISSLLLIVSMIFTGLNFNNSASAEGLGNDIIIRENYKSVDGDTEPETTINGSQIFQKSNVIQGPISTFGIVTGSQWGAYVSSGNGYVVYKLQADEGYRFGSSQMTFSGHHGHHSCGGLFGATNSDIRISVSSDGINYETVYSLAIAIDGNWQDGIDYFDIPVAIGYLVEGLSVAYIKIDLIAASIEKLQSDPNNSGWLAAASNGSGIDLGRTPSRLYDVDIVATQEKILTGSSIVTVNYGDKNSQTLSVLNGEKFTGFDYIPYSFIKADNNLYLDKACTVKYDQNKIVNGDLNLYVKGEYKNFAINYNLDGGKNATANTDTYYTVDGLVLDAPTKAGYVFLGWYTDSNFETKIEAIPQGVEGEVNLYAKWQKIENTATYSGDTGSSSSMNGAPYIAGGIVLLACALVLVRKLKKSK